MRSFNHYRDRFVNQIESLTMERQLCERIKTFAKILQESGEMTANQVRKFAQFSSFAKRHSAQSTELTICSPSNLQTLYLRNAIDTLRRCRRTLAYTYVFAYNLQRNNQVEIFEDNQADLEAAVERLSGYLEHEVTESIVVKCRPHIIDRSK